ncbi:MAG: hypothetical protein H6519_05745 [Microthrixaceae bacterium]|nr:hypothetical protein [Acidimicrobiales bacterium]MCB9403922.1 hypothetical protein [Microthrixaceae bacterium]
MLFVGIEWAEDHHDLGGYHDDNWIFPRLDGTPIHPERFSREFLRKQ